ncbi:MAG: aminoacyl-tRNA hydrolase [Ruminococcaceae bacterium]|nr:aminoacyl-tRNA hydrolase [Oscillospiraceae bacterium]
MDYIIVGLGNPGKQYEYTRHNVGWLAVDYITRKLGIKINKLKFKSLCGEANINGKKVLFLKPQTYMNLSGEAVVAAAGFYKVPTENILVLCDDIALPSNKLRIRRQGSDGGHRGLRSIITLLGSDRFPRLKIGVSDRENPKMDLKDWVVGDFSDKELDELDKILPDIYDIADLFVSNNLDKAMAKYN